MTRMGWQYLVLPLAFAIKLNVAPPPVADPVHTNIGYDYVTAPRTKSVILTEVNSQYIETGLFQNWLYYATPYLNRTFSLVFDCPEKKAQQELLEIVPKIKLPIDAYLLDSDYSLVELRKSKSRDLHQVKKSEWNDGRYGTREYKQMMVRRPQAIHSLLQKNYSVLLIDLDTVWIKDPFVQMHKAGLDRDLLLTRDGDEGYAGYCGCFLFFNPSSKGLDIAHEWKEESKTADGDGPDQLALNSILHKREERGWDVKELPIDHFPPGMWANKYKNASVYHANWMRGSDTKVNWLKRHNLWHDPRKTGQLRSLATEDLERVFKDDHEVKQALKKVMSPASGHHNESRHLAVKSSHVAWSDLAH